VTRLSLLTCKETLHAASQELSKAGSIPSDISVTIGLYRFWSFRKSQRDSACDAALECGDPAVARWSVCNLNSRTHRTISSGSLGVACNGSVLKRKLVPKAGWFHKSGSRAARNLNADLR
jgi:hypothetical protein